MSEADADRDRMRTAASVLSADPPIIYVRPRPQPFGLAGLLARRNPGRPFTCIVRTMWTIEDDQQFAELAFVQDRFRAHHPHVRIIVAANTPGELQRLQAAGIESVFANHNMFVDERIFRPLPRIERIYDAVYNANFSPFKRRHLARDIARCVHIGYVADPTAKDDMAPQLRAAMAELPQHDFLNGIAGTQVLRLKPGEVNRVLAQASVGLCLSEKEGPMVASVEYLLAGLPVVTTPNSGGRDRYFTADTAVTAEPNPRAIREAVEALKARDLPRQLVRRKTLRLIERDRDAFNSFIERLRGGRPPIGADPRWRFSYVNNLYHWRSVGAYAADLGFPPRTDDGGTRLWYEGED